MPNPIRTVLVAAFLIVCATAVRAEQPVALELVLAIDTSASVDDREHALQVEGLARAFRSPLVIETIRAAGDTGIAVTLVEWSSSLQQSQSVGWTHVFDAASAARFAASIDGVRARTYAGNTAIGNALRFSAVLFHGNGFAGKRQVIDVSGDGRNNSSLSPERARDRYVAAGITINGLAIRTEDRALDDYYRTHVIGGTGAFVETARDYADFARAIIRKLLREIASPLSQNENAPAWDMRGRARVGLSETNLRQRLTSAPAP